MIKSKKQMLLVITIFTLILTVGSVTYAFFNYTRTGEANVIKTGRISFISRQTETINLTNLFPIDPTETGIMNDTTKVGTFEIEVEGDTDYVGGIEYLVSAVNSHVTTSTGQIVPISLDISVEGLGTYENNYFEERESKDTKIYKRLSGNGIMGDGNILVGYIPQNTTLGTPSGINGKITIKAYLDKNKIAISDTYDGNETDLMGTTNDWVDGRVVLTTDEWNSLQQNGISFQVKVEANEDIWVEETLYDVVERQTVMDNINSTYVNNTTPGIDFSNISSDTNGKGVYTFSSTSNDAYPVMYYRGAVENNNVLFANKCWKMVRTTDTGGVKLIYNGENKGTSEVPDCDNTGTDSQITLNIDGTDVNTFAFNENANSPAYVGYMYGSVYEVTNGEAEDSAYFGNSFIYDSTNNLYTLTNVKEWIDYNHHYTCNLTTTDGTCENIRYYYAYGTRNGKQYYLYFTLINGKSIEDALKEMQENNNDSNAKKMIDSWYEDNIDNTSYENKLEDTLFCNDRSIYSLGGLNPNDGMIGISNSTVYYSGYERQNVIKRPSLSCRKNDAFTIKNGKGNGALDYPVALLSSDEMILSGGGVLGSVISYLNNGTDYWLMSPYNFTSVNNSADFSTLNGAIYYGIVNKSRGLRPVLSLKNGITIVDNDADGTASKPYVIK